MPAPTQSAPAVAPVPLRCAKCGSRFTVVARRSVLVATYDEIVGWETTLPCSVCLAERGSTYHLVRDDHLVIETHGAFADFDDPDYADEITAETLENVLLYLQDEQDRAAETGGWELPPAPGDALEDAMEYARAGDFGTVRASISAWRDALSRIGVEIDDDSYHRRRPGDTELIAYALSHGYRARPRIRKHYGTGRMTEAWEWARTGPTGARIPNTTITVFGPWSALPPVPGQLRHALEELLRSAGPDPTTTTPLQP